MMTKHKTIKVIPDTNVLIKGFLSHRNSSRLIINLARAGRVVLYGTPASCAEFLEKIQMNSLKPYLNGYQTDVSLLETNYKNLINIVDIPAELSTLHVSPDSDDNTFFQLAECIGAKIIVSYDGNGILRVQHNDIRTLVPERFIEHYKKANSGELY